MNMYRIIQKKKSGEALTSEEIRFFVQGYTDGSIPDYQASAFCMAVCFQGMTDEETACLTEEMMNSGETVDLSFLGDRSVDKHSTGGVGDKTTLILAPIVAAAGGVVAKMSGRGLGHTGGTVDKMESVPGLRTDLSPEEFLSVSQKVGMCVVGQNKTLAPADQKLYALRDVTATVDSIPLIASSIMSKKLAAGAKNIVLDVKCGSGAFMKTEEEAKALAEAMVRIGKALGRNVRAFLTDMSAPLGCAVGNALEVREAIEVLRGEGDEDLTELCLALAGEMISLSTKVEREEGQRIAREMLQSKKALEKMKEWIEAQGGDSAVVDETERLPLAPFSKEVLSPFEGYLCELDALQIGIASGELGAGRKTKSDPIDFGAGIRLRKKVGERVKQGEVLATLYTSDPALLETAEKRVLSAIRLSPRKVKKTPVILNLL